MNAQKHELPDTDTRVLHRCFMQDQDKRRLFDGSCRPHPTCLIDSYTQIVILYRTQAVYRGL